MHKMKEQSEIEGEGRKKENLIQSFGSPKRETKECEQNKRERER